MIVRPALIPLLFFGAAASAGAAGVRLSGQSTVHSIELRELVREEIPLADAPGTGTVRRLPDGRWVECDEADSTCVVYASAEAGRIAMWLHDLRANGWARGGWSFSSHARLRQVGDAESDLWPRSDDEFDLLSLQVEYRRSHWLLRAGRQWRESALGVANFDGLSAHYGTRHYGGKLYGGYSLLRTVYETADGDALAAVEEFAPNEPSRLFGGGARWRWPGHLQASGAYERELRDDRRGFQSERLALDASGTHAGATLSMRLQRDLASDRNNELQFGLQSPRWRELGASLAWRRHVPYFEAWTIWNVFSPVSFDEWSTQLDWSPARAPLRIAVHAAQRDYDEANTGLQFAPLRDDGWNAGAQVQYRFTPRWESSASYRADIGPGEARSQLIAQLSHRPHAKLQLTGFFTGFDYVREYRVSGRTVLGGGLRANWDLPNGNSLFGSFAHYAHDAEGSTDFGQTRAQLGVRWQLGADPGVAR